MHILNNVKALRKEKGLTQSQLAERVSVSRRTIISLEKSNYTPSLLLAFRIAQILEVSIEEAFFMGGDTDEENNF